MREKPKNLKDRFVFLFYLFLSFIILMPFSQGIGRVVPGPRGDTWQNIWNFWWVRKAIVEDGVSPFWTPALLHPHGADLSYHTLSLLNTILSVPLGGFLSPIALYGLALFLAFPIGAWGTYLLAKDLSGNRAGALLAGFLYAFFPHHVDHIYAHLNLTSNQFLPFFLLFLYRTIKNPSGRNASLTGLFLAMQTYACWTYMMHGLLLALLLAAARIVRPSNEVPIGRWLPRFSFSFGLFLLLILPLLYQPLRSSAARGEFRYKAVRPTLSASVETLLTPSITHPLVGKKVKEANRRHLSLPRGSTTYLGYGTIILTLIGLASPMKGKFFLGAGAVLFLALSLGPELQLKIGEGTGIPLPYRVFQGIPILRFLRVPNRFLTPASLMLAPLVAAGFAHLLSRRRGKVAAFPLALLIFLEYVPTPVSAVSLAEPPFCRALAERAESGAVMDVPLFLGSRSSLYMFYQTFHGRPIVAGYVSIDPPHLREITEEDPFLAWVADTKRRPEIVGVPEEDPAPALRRLRIGDVVLHKDFDTSLIARQAPPGMEWAEKSEGASWYWTYKNVAGPTSHKRMNQYRRELERWLGAPYLEDERIAIFAVPPE